MNVAISCLAGFATGLVFCVIGEAVGALSGHASIGLATTLGLYYLFVFGVTWARLS